MIDDQQAAFRAGFHAGQDAASRYCHAVACQIERDAPNNQYVEAGAGTLRLAAYGIVQHRVSRSGVPITRRKA